ncbi:phenoloxidase 1-like [Ischnura elegans]|uniref:phenoloxidase 1-like n=1 Tax=Ischnura elegans TaxID=197161 RepID=UPI001ED8B3B9|nr:phenoloxidase 1-like [Ischnura elegans]
MAQTANPQQQMLYLLERPKEPYFIPKGERGAVFDVPSNDYLTDRFRPLADELGNRFGEEAQVRIPVNPITVPDISLATQLGRNEFFSLFIPYHREMAGRLIDIFMGMRSYQDFLSASLFCRERVNPYMFVYALSVAILHRNDTKNIRLPPLSEIFPDKYLDARVFSQAREEANVAQESSRIPIEIPRDYTASDLDEEHRVAYFREDIGINLHHWHWHLVYPFNGPRAIVDKDRRGELFYYMHQQIQARYNFERFCNGLGRVKRLHDFRAPLPEGYFSKLDNTMASRVYASRPAGMVLQDISRDVDQLVFDIQDLERWRDRIIEAIHLGRVINDKGEIVELTEMGGVDVLGNIIEASILSINRNLYGDMHNLGHVAIGIVHDPDFRHLETYTPVADPSTAMRDPVFYRLHAFVDELFHMHKRTLPRYTVAQLDYPGIKVTSVEVMTKGRNKNELATYWQKRDVDLSRGVDFSPRGAVFARITHLQHEPFVYRILVENGSNSTMSGTVRIFMAPKFDERKIPMLFRDQRILFIELDKFVVELKPKTNVIERASTLNSLTIPWEQTFRDLEVNTPGTGAESQANNYCGCGWPEHMLIPKGAPGGFPCELFVMISNIKDDLVQQPKRQDGCPNAASFCGLRDQKYPEKRSMGYPFDRMPRTGVDTLKQFLTPNMMVTDVSIHHFDRTEPPPKSDAK